MENTGKSIGIHAPDFELPGIDDQVHHLARYLDRYRAVCTVFMCNHCPYVRGYLERLKQIQSQFEGRDFTLIGINSNDAVQYPEDGFEKMKSFAREHGLNFPYLRDANQDVAASFGAHLTPQVFLLDQSGVVGYSGAIDDSPDDPKAVGVHYLRDAIAQLLDGETIRIPSSQPVGCSLKWRQSPS
ncbi:thioredoxin family protein [Oxynema aestuarii]|jgi:peroxiredoxin|uniref:Thioredoxin family protein n=1 Tax=Oxynema aestuarii AP17 TaxID=2064643 RepID=A0A6H1U1S2_9CYAN|nr:thioredoxin family protein [Oxynema aestuarii]QIZ72784.1 thioredoxin family protein [Oxynema aestuarii AP17]RMH77652.1 MAG: thioredoxin family protein [Cyanobacteria bacterium J007]